MLSHLTITQKLSAGFALIIAIIVVLVGIARYGFQRVDETVDWNIHTYQVIDQAGMLLVSLTNIETGMRGFALSGQEEFLEPFNGGKEGFEKSWATLKQLTSDNPQQQRRLDELKATQEKWLSEDIQGTLDLRRAVVGGTRPMDDVVQRIVQRQDKQKMDNMRRLVAEIRGEEEKLLTTRREALTSVANYATGSLIVGGIVSALVALIIAFTLSTNLKHRLNSAVQVANAIAAGRLNVAIKNTSQDEIGKLLHAFAAMQTRLREMIMEIKQSSRDLLDAARNISNVSGELSSAALDQSQSASSMAATVEQLTVSISHVATNASEAHGISTDSGKQSAEGGEVIQRTLQSMSDIATTVQSSAGQVAQLGQHIEQISSIVNVITEIAEQTNLLALNAAIEAARAGDQGRGFAVVADEVRLLAQRTGKSTQEISDMIKTIQASAHDAVSRMEVGVDQVDSGLKLAQAANGAIEQIRQGSTRIISVVDQISMALQEQAAASQDVARAVERIAQMAERNSHGIAGASQNAATVEQLALSLERQVKQFEI